MIADICVFCIVLLFIILGYKAGFLRSCVNLAAFGVSICISLLIYPIVSSLIMQTTAYGMLVDFIKSSYLANADEAVVNSTLKLFEGVLKDNANILADGIAGSIATLIINVITFVLVVVLCRLLLFAVTHIFDLFAKLPVIRQFNRLGGSVLGGIIGIAVVYLVLAIFMTVLPMDTAGVVAKEIESSTIASQLYYNNILILFIS